MDHARQQCAGALVLQASIFLVFFVFVGLVFILVVALFVFLFLLIALFFLFFRSGEDGAGVRRGELQMFRHGFEIECHAVFLCEIGELPEVSPIYVARV